MPTINTRLSRLLAAIPDSQRNGLSPDEWHELVSEETTPERIKALVNKMPAAFRRRFTRDLRKVYGESQ